MISTNAKGPPNIRAPNDIKLGGYEGMRMLLPGSFKLYKDVNDSMRLLLIIWLVFTGTLLYGQYGIGPLRLYTLEREAVNLKGLRKQFPDQPLAFIFWDNAEFPSTKLLLDLRTTLDSNAIDSNIVFLLVQTAGKLNLRRYRSSNNLNREITAGRRTVTHLFPDEQRVVHLLDLYSKTARRIVLGEKPRFPTILLFNRQGNLVMRNTQRGTNLAALLLRAERLGGK